MSGSFVCYTVCMTLIFNASDIWSSVFFFLCDQKPIFLSYFSATHLELTALCIKILVLGFFSSQEQIIRDNLISALNHCDLVYSVSLACPTLLFSFSSSLSRFVSERCISITNATPLPNHGQMRGNYCNITRRYSRSSKNVHSYPGCLLSLLYAFCCNIIIMLRV